MCRFTFYRGDSIALSALLTVPENSLINQSTHARERQEPLNGDGFGVCWYVPDQEEAGRFRSVSPAWSNQNLRSLSRVVESACVLAHVRAATLGLEVMETNCHPFKRGRYSFMHNGSVGGFEEIRRPLQASLSDTSFRALRGTTDSEHVFALFMDEIEKEEEEGADAMAAALDRAASRVVALIDEHADGAPSKMNLVVSDGNDAVACRQASGGAAPESLYFSKGKRYVCENRICRMVDSEEGRGARAVLISSEPLYDSDKWEMIPLNHMVKVSGGLGVRMVAMS